jgi:cytochrome b561
MPTTLAGILQALQALARVFAALPAHHALFGLLLWVLVLLRFRAQPKKSISHPDDLRAASKDQSRLVYLLLYLEVGTNILMGLPAENLQATRRRLFAPPPSRAAPRLFQT